MTQDYDIQIENLNRLKATVLALVESLNSYNASYRAAVDSSRENGLSVQMYERLGSLNVPQTTAHVTAFIESIEQIDLPWINRLIEGFNSAREVAGAATPVGSKAESFRAATHRIKESAAIQTKKDADGQPQNQRDIHADYLAAFLASRKSR